MPSPAALQMAAQFKGQTLRLPNLKSLLAKWPSTMSPHYPELKEIVESKIVEWIPDERSRAKARHVDLAFFSASWYPFCTLDRLETMCWYSLWIFLWDDVIEDSTVPVRTVQQQALKYMEHHLGLAPASSPEPPAPTKYCALFQHCAKPLRAECTISERRRFLDQIGNYMEGCEVEQEFVLGGKLPALEEYWDHRLYTSSVWTYCAIADYMAGVHLPEEMYETDEMKALWFELNRHIVTYGVSEAYCDLDKKIVGRGGQVVIGYISWIALSNLVAISIQKSPVSYTTFWGIFLHQESTLVSTYRLITDRSFYRALRSKLAIVFAVVSLVFVLAFPTLADAMTGYVPAAGSAYVREKSGDNLLVPFSRFDEVAYIIHDGWRVNGTANDIIPQGNTYSDGPMIYNKLRKRADSASRLEDCHEVNIGACPYARSVVTTYVRTYGFFGLNTTTGNLTVFDGVPVEGPPLNISAFHISNRYDDERTRWVDPRTGEAPFRNSQASNAVFVYGNETYTAQEIIRDGRCQTVSDEGYQWGFSFLQLFIVTILLILWTAGTWAMWFKAHLNHSHKVPKSWKGLLHLTSAIKDELAASGIDPTTLTHQQLAVQIQDRLNGGRVFSQAADEHAPASIRQHVWKNWKKQIWALFLLVGHVGVLVFYLHQVIGWVVEDGGDFPWQFAPMLVVWWISLHALLILSLVGVRRRYLFLYLVLSVGVNTAAGMVPTQNLYL